jgi:hypothetical protein
MRPAGGYYPGLYAATDLNIMKAPVILLIAAVVVLIIGGVWWYARPFDHFAATVWLSNRGANCAVTKHGVSHWQQLPCSEIPRHLRGTLHLSSGEHIAITATKNVSQASIRDMKAQLVQWGYTVPKVFRTETFTVDQSL